MYELTKDKSFYLPLTILKSIYFIPGVTEGPRLIWFRFVFVLFRLATLVIFIILPSIHLSINVRAKTGLDLSEDFSTIFGMVGALQITIAFLFLYQKWSQFFVDLEDCNKFGIPENIETLRKRMNLFSIVYALYMVSGVTIYGIISATETSYCKRFNEEHDLNEICGAFSPLVLPFDLDNGFLRSFVFLTQMFLAMLTLSGPSMICFVIYEAAETVILHIELLKTSFPRIFETENEIERRKRLGFCVRYHNNLLSLCDRLGILAKYTTGLFCMTCAVMLGCIGNLILKSKPVRGMCYILGYIGALFMLCHSGQRIQDETLSVGEVIFHLTWYDGSVELMKDLNFILARCQRPATLASLPLGAMNYPLFLMVMKTSYSYLTLLNQHT